MLFVYVWMLIISTSTLIVNIQGMRWSLSRADEWIEREWASYDKFVRESASNGKWDESAEWPSQFVSRHVKFCWAGKCFKNRKEWFENYQIIAMTVRWMRDERSLEAKTSSSVTFKWSRIYLFHDNTRLLWTGTCTYIFNTDGLIRHAFMTGDEPESQKAIDSMMSIAGIDLNALTFRSKEPRKYVEKVLDELNFITNRGSSYGMGFHPQDPRLKRIFSDKMVFSQFGEPVSRGLKATAELLNSMGRALKKPCTEDFQVTFADKQAVSFDLTRVCWFRKDRFKMAFTCSTTWIIDEKDGKIIYNINVCPHDTTARLKQAFIDNLDDEDDLPWSD